MLLVVLLMGGAKALGAVKTLPVTEKFDDGTSGIFTVGTVFSDNTNIGNVLAVGKNSPITLDFDTDTETEGNQAYELKENETVTFSYTEYNGYYSAASTATMELKNSDGVSLISYVYNTKDCKITDVKIGGTTVSGFAAFHAQSCFNTSGNANGLVDTRNNKPYVSTEKYNPQITFSISHDGYAKITFNGRGSKLGAEYTEEFSAKIPNGVNINLGSFNFTSTIDNDERRCAIDNFSITSEISEETKYGYTINYLLDGTNIQTIQGKASADGTVTAESPITIDGTKYFVKDGAQTAFTVSATEDNIFNVNLRKAEIYKVVLNAVNADKTVIKELARREVAEGDATEITLYAPKYITDANNKVTHKIANESYGIKCAVSNEAQTVEYSSYAGDAWFVEGEAVLGGAGMENSNYSGGYAHRGINTLKNFITVPEIGKYNMTYAVCNYNTGRECSVSFYKNEESEKNVIATKNVNFSVNYVKTNGTVKVEDIEFANGDVIKVLPSTTNCILDYILIEKTADVLSLSSDYKLSTYAPETDVDLTNEAGVKFYAAKVNGTSVTLTEVIGKVKAGTGLVVENNNNAASVTLATATNGKELSENDLVGVTADMTGADFEGKNAYVLVSDTKFQKVDATTQGTLTKGKAYLLAGNTAAARLLTIGNPTAINGVTEKAAEGTDAIYNIQGVRVDKADASGLYIIGGKKYIKK